MDLEFTRTQRGFARADFTDLYGAGCSIQRSSLLSPDAVWLGVDQPGDGNSNRMHLTREHAAALWPALKHFAETGELPARKEGQ